MSKRALSTAALLLTSQLAQAELYSGTAQTTANRFIENDILSGANPAFHLPRSAVMDMGRIRGDGLVFDYYHSEDRDVGLRLYIAREDVDARKALTRQMQREGFFEDGDVVLTYHPEWTGTGPYPSVMAGISHAGMMYEEGDGMRNIDMPLNEAQMLDMRSGSGTPSYLE